LKRYRRARIQDLSGSGKEDGFRGVNFPRSWNVILDGFKAMSPTRVNVPTWEVPFLNVSVCAVPTSNMRVSREPLSGMQTFNVPISRVPISREPIF
jgi:hypothetical protein